MDQLDGAAVRAWAAAAADSLARSAALIDAVNVFPVPDGDTGTNVRLTVAGGALAAAQAPSTDDAAQVARAFARGSLRAARGNSGVIVSQYLQGFADGLLEPCPPSGSQQAGDVLARALVQAAAESARAVARPQEGTVLTVARQLGEHARRAAQAGASPSEALGSALDGARRDLRQVSAVNPVLRASGVVDAGACALLVLLEALELTLAGPAS